MSYIKSVVPLTNYRLLLEMNSTSSVIVDLSIKLHTMKYKELQDENLFTDVETDGDYVIWGGGRVKITVNELLDVVLSGEKESDARFLTYHK